MRRSFAISALLFLFTLFPAFAESYGVSMNGPNEIPPGDMDGAGFADLILEGSTLHYSVVVFNIETPTAMHIHPGRRDETGPPLIPFASPFTRVEGCPSFAAAPCSERFINVGAVELDQMTADVLHERPADFYLNIHNAAYPGGAVRGQVQYARYLPIVGQTPGAAQTNWFTRFGVLNRSTTEESDWSIEFLPHSSAGNTSRFTAEQSPVGALSLDSSSEFPVENFAGIGTARVLSDLPLNVVASIYNGELGTRGDFGFAVRGLELENARTSGVLVDLTSASPADVHAMTGHRTNVGFFNPQVVTVVATFRVYGSDGIPLGVRTGTMPPGAMRQSDVWALITDVAENDRVQDSFWISWEASAPIFVYATVVNNETGDAEIRD